MVKQDTKILQKQVLSQHMQQSTKILQMGSLALLEYMQNFMIDNPFIVWQPPQYQKYDKILKKIDWLDASDEQNSYYYQQDRAEQQESQMFQKKQRETLKEYLFFQINILPIKTKQKQPLSFLIESIKQDGYLEKDSLQAVKQRFHLTQEQTQELVDIIQSLEPAGVGAQNLKQCLLLQLKRKQKKYSLCEKIIQQYLELLAKNQLHIIAKELKVKVIEVVEASRIIKQLYPKPGITFLYEEKIEYIFPDIIVERKEEQFSILLNEQYFPKLKINHCYKQILNMDTTAKEYITTKLNQAEWFIKCMEKREQTLLKTAECIIQLQKPFFEQKTEGFLPMRLCDVAEKAGIHESTVSRAVREKYLQCCRGTFPLTSFFSTALSTKSNENISSDCIKKYILKMIEQEEKTNPLNDRTLTEKLNEMGIEISRRTVTKYRHTLGISGAGKRKSF